MYSCVSRVQHPHGVFDFVFDERDRIQIKIMVNRPGAILIISLLSYHEVKCFFSSFIPIASVLIKIRAMESRLPRGFLPLNIYFLYWMYAYKYTL